MMIEFEISPAAIDSVSELAALAEACFASPWTARQLENAITGQRSLLLAARSGGGLCGMLALSWVLDEASVDDVAVLPAFRRLGIAAALLDNAAALAKENGCLSLLLEVRASNAPALALYEKHGFKKVGLRRGYYEKPREDAVLMTKIL